MSLGCCECEGLIGPSDELPGREGVLVHPVLVSFVYFPTKEGDPSYKLSYIWASQNRSLCFNCIERRLPEGRKDVLGRIYESYKAETTLGRIRENQNGRLIEVGGEEDQEARAAYDQFEKERSLLESKCLFCNTPSQDGKPFFRASVIDKVYSEQHQSGLFVLNNYSFSNLRGGTTSFNICFNDLRNNFPRVFESLSYDLLGEENPSIKPKPNEIYLTPEIQEALFRETGKGSNKILDEAGVKGLRIICIPKDIH